MLNTGTSLQVVAFVEKYRSKEEVMEMQALVEEIAALVQKIKAGTVTLGELEAFAAATNQLNERAIVLRYKAYEANVYGISTSPMFQSGSSMLDDRNSTSSDNSTSEETGVQADPVAEVEEAPEVEEAVEIGFDLFSMDDAEATEETTEEIVDESREEDEIMEISAFEAEPDVEEPTFEAPETELTPEIQEEIHAATPADLTFEAEDEPADEYQSTTVNEIPAQTMVQEPAATSNFNEHPVLRKALTNDGTLQSRLLTVRLETLKSAFGLNERLQIVKELFNGSNEAYSSAIDQLDNQAEKTSARSLVNNLAHTYSWDVESDLAVEFVQKVERRYA